MFQGGCYVAAFLICVVVLKKVRSHSARVGVLLIASLGLYLTWAPWFAAVLVGSAVMNFGIGIWLRRRPHWMPLFTGIVLNLAVLFVFKYLPELAGCGSLGNGFWVHLALPLGISFWTFQAMSYLFDLYREEALDPNFFEFLLYMSFFPVTISGPVCRLPDMLPQFRSDASTNLSDIGEGLRRIGIGVLMMQFAKLLGRGILGGDGIISGFDHASNWTGPDTWCLAFGFGLQLFFDFAGYSHIAIGAAKALGIAVPENFDRPFASTTPSMFWTRWHMSLSFWIRDYVFLPLAMTRREIWWRNLALVVSMVLFGLWHNATWLFLIWGAYHGVLLVLHRVIQQIERKFDWNPPAIWTPFSWTATIFLISLGWIFFRANSMEQAGTMLRAIASPASYGSHVLSSSLYVLVASLAFGYAAVVGVAGMLDRSAEESSGFISIAARRKLFWVASLCADFVIRPDDYLDAGWRVCAAYLPAILSSTWRPLKRTLLFVASPPGTHVPGYWIPSLRDSGVRDISYWRIVLQNEVTGAIAAYRSSTAARHRTSNSTHFTCVPSGRNTGKPSQGCAKADSLAEAARLKGNKNIPK